jgi:hypothetical protein
MTTPGRISASDCAAKPAAGGVFECERCAQAWEDGDKPLVCRVLTNQRLREVAADEAARIEQSQRALVAAGLRERRSAEMLSRAMEFRVMVRLFDKARGGA